MSNEIAILGAGMHPWGKWGHNFVEYGVAAAREALADAGVPWKDVSFVSGGATVRCGYPGYVAGATFAQALGWQGAEVNTSYAACASGSQALAAARNKILAGECEVALVIGAAITINLLAAALTGAVLPLVLERLGIDPALAGGVILTTVTDVVGFLSFLGLATIFLLGR